MLHVKRDDDRLPVPPELLATLAINGISPSEDQINKLALYVESLARWNTRHNLISRRDVPNIWGRHIVHAISPLMKIHFPQGLKVVDIGSGGGLPGIPIAILRPDYHVTLVDSVRKKANALSEIVRDAGVQNTQVVCARAETLKESHNFLYRFDVAFARAVSSLTDLIEWSLPLLEKKESSLNRLNSEHDGERRIELPHPALLAYKGGDLSSEIAEARKAFVNVRISVLDLEFVGSKQYGLTDKKLVIVHT